MIHPQKPWIRHVQPPPNMASLSDLQKLDCLGLSVFFLPDYLIARPHCFETDHAVATRQLQSGGATELFARIDLGDVGQEVQDTAGVAPLVVVPADKLDEVRVERDAGLGIEDGRVGVADEIARDDLVLGVSEDT